MTDKTPMTQFIGVPLDELPQTNPPRSYEDIGARWSKPEGAELFTAPDLVLENPDLLDLWKTLVTAARENPLVEVDGHTIRRVMDGEEIDRQIAEQREEYERARRTFHRYMNGEHRGDMYHFSVSDYISRENIEWDAEWVAEQVKKDDEEDN